MGEVRGIDTHSSKCPECNPPKSSSSSKGLLDEINIFLEEKHAPWASKIISNKLLHRCKTELEIF
jgi:hypothetical protein